MSDLLSRAGARSAIPPAPTTTLHLVDVAPVLDAITELAAEVNALRAAVAAPRPDSLMTVAQIATLLQVHNRTVRRWVADGTFPTGMQWHRGARGGRRWRRSEVDAWIAKHAERS